MKLQTWTIILVINLHDRLSESMSCSFSSLQAQDKSYEMSHVLLAPSGSSSPHSKLVIS